MSDEELQDQYELFVLGVADRAAEEEIRERLTAGDEATIRAIANARTLVTGLALAAPLVEPPDDLGRRVAGLVRRESKSFGGWLWAWAAATALLALLAFNFWQRERTKATELAAVHQELLDMGARLGAVQQVFDFMNEPDLKVTGFGLTAPQPPKGRVLTSATRGVLLLVSSLPPAQQGRTYEMWLVPKSGAPIPAGLFQTSAEGRALHIRPGAVDLTGIAAIALSDEPAAGSTAPTTVPFLAVPLGG